MNYEVIIYIHGISPDEDLATVANAQKTEDLKEIQDPKRKAKISHRKEYQSLKNGISKYIQKETKQSFWDQAEHCFPEWGWEYQESDAQNLGASHRLKDAQHQLGRRVIKAIKANYYISLIPQNTVRKLALYGLSDAFYYVSSDGRNSVSASIYHQIANKLAKIISDPNANISLTLIGHSAGSVIAFDLVSFLFSEDNLYVGELKAQARKLQNNLLSFREERERNNTPYTKGEAALEDTLEVVESQINMSSSNEIANVMRKIARGEQPDKKKMIMDPNTKRVRIVSEDNPIARDALTITPSDMKVSVINGCY